MPSTSKKQHNFMEAVAHNPSFAKKVGIPQSVGKDFSTADKGKTFKRGGDMATMDPKMMAMKSAKRRGASMAPTGMAGMGGMGMKKGGMTMAAFEKSGKDVEKKGVKEGSKADMAMDKKQMAAMKKGGMTKKMATGGSASSRADGVAQRGKTKGKNFGNDGPKMSANTKR
jgi:hypothetical protein